MNDAAVLQATGRSGPEWFSVIRQAGKTGAPHKEIARFLHEDHGVTAWWAQEITVECERQSGRRVLGQTQDGLFQVGVSKTIEASVGRVWACLGSPRAISLVTAFVEGAERNNDGSVAAAPPGLGALETLQGESDSGVRVSTTACAPGSHVRLRWHPRRWSTPSILQIRVTPKSATKTTVSFHHEKLPSQDERRHMREHWRRVAALIAEMTTAAGSKRQ